MSQEKVKLNALLLNEIEISEMAFGVTFDKDRVIIYDKRGWDRIANDRHEPDDF